MASDTKDRILNAALEMFAENGYKGTNLRDLAAKLEISKSAIYRHYDSKEEIWNALIDSVELYYSQRVGSGNNMPKIPESLEEFKEITLKMINATVHDPKIILIRKVLIAEQFRDEQTAKLATKHLLSSMEGVFAYIFDGMIKNGLIKEYDPQMISFSFTTPIGSMIQLSDREPDRCDVAMEKIKEFIEHFICVYGKK